MFKAGACFVFGRLRQAFTYTGDLKTELNVLAHRHISLNTSVICKCHSLSLQTSFTFQKYSFIFAALNIF